MLAAGVLVAAAVGITWRADDIHTGHADVSRARLGRVVCRLLAPEPSRRHQRVAGAHAGTP